MKKTLRIELIPETDKLPMEHTFLEIKVEDIHELIDFLGQISEMGFYEEGNKIYYPGHRIFEIRVE